MTITSEAPTVPEAPSTLIADEHSAPVAGESPTHLVRSLDHIFRRPDTLESDHIRVVKLVHAISRAVFEILAGYRSLQQLAFAVEPTCVEKLRHQRILQCADHAGAADFCHCAIRSVHLSRNSADAFECTSILAFKDRVRAVALRVERWHGRWQVTSLEVL